MKGWRKPKGVAQGPGGSTGTNAAEASKKNTVTFDESEFNRLRAELEKAKQEREKEREGRLAAEKALEKTAEVLEKTEAELEKTEEALEKTEEALEKQNRPVGHCIQNSSFTTKPFPPKWGDALLPGESTLSTTTKKSWLPVCPENVTQWTDDKLIQYLQEADDVKVERDGEQVPILQVIKEGKADTTLQGYLSGALATGAASLPSQRVKNEDWVETMLIKYLWTPLEMIMQGDLGNEDSDRFPIKKYARLQITPGGGTSNPSFVPMPPQYKRFYDLDRSIEFEYHPKGLLSEPRLILPHVLEDTKEMDVALDYVARHSRTVVEVKPDVLCPKSKVNSGENHEAKNHAYSGNLVDYIQSPHFDPLFNPVAQVVTYGFATRTKCLMIHTLNQMTLGLILDEDPNRIQVLLSNKFDSTVRLPFSSSVTSEQPAASWSLWEVLIRFVLASTKHWYVKHFPDALKAKFKERQDQSRKDSKKRSQPGQDKLNEHSSDPDVDPSSSAGDEKAFQGYTLAPFSYADLWAPLRFAIPATHSIEQESTSERLDGDAELIGCGRIGPVYRQTLQGKDVAVKLLILTVKREIDDIRRYPTDLRDELKNEVEAYNHLRSLQGKTIPILLWHGTLVEDMADALATEYCGSQLPEQLSEEQKVSAMQALDSLHDNGVLHGDVAARNFVLKDNQIRILDFGFAKFRDSLSEAEWLERVHKEKAQLRKELGIEESRKRPHALTVDC